MVRPRWAQEDHTHPGAGGGTITPSESSVAYGVPRLAAGASLTGALSQTPSGTALTLPTPTSGGSVFDTRIRVGRSITATTAGFVSGNLTFHMTRGFATLQRFGFSNLQTDNRVWAGLTKSTSISSGAVPFTSMVGVWQDGGNIMVGTGGGDHTDSGVTFQEDLEYVVTTYCAPGASAVSVTFTCENGDTGSHVVTDVAHSTGAYSMQVGANKDTGATGAEVWFIYWGAVQPD
mgnify:CR=1 FL=1